MRKSLIALILILSIVHIPGLSGQEFPQLQFQQISQKDGLSSNLVQSIAEDHNGFIWVGTANGLNRLDGYRIRQYYHDEKDENSICNNRVFHLYCDRKGRLWASTTIGASCLLPGTNRFINFTPHEKTAGRRIKTETIPRFFEDRSGRFFIVSSIDGVYELKDDLTLTLSSIRPEPFVINNIRFENFSHISQDEKGQIWAAAGKRIYQLDPRMQQAIRLYDLGETLVKEAGITGLYCLPGPRYFVTSWTNGVMEFFPQTGKTKLIPQPFSADKIGSTVVSWNYNNQRWICFPSENNGLVICNDSLSANQLVHFEAGQPNTISGSFFPTCFTDSKNNLWVASTSGINLVRSGQFTILSLTNPGQKPFTSPFNGTPFGFAEINGAFWINKRYNGTFILGPDLSIRRFFLSLYPFSTSIDNATHAAYEFIQRGNEVFITTDSGMVVVDTALRYSRLVFPSAYRKSADLRNAVMLNQDEALIRTYSSGLFVFNLRAKQFTRYFKNSDTCATCLPVYLNWIGKTRKGRIFLTSSGAGLLEYLPANGQFIRISANAGTASGWKTTVLKNFIEDEEGKLWITSTNGLYIYDPEKNTVIRHINENNRMGGLSKIIRDNSGNIWTSGFSGIWCFIRSRQKWILFGKPDGLPGEDFETGLYKDHTGKIWAGVEGGTVIFDPEKLSQNSNTFAVRITEAMTSGQVLAWQQSGGRKELSIAPGIKNISVDFAIAEYQNNKQNHYWYQLSPLMKSFEENADGHLNFTGLTPGTYTLRVKGSDRYGNFFTGTDELILVIKPYWYETTAFKLAVFLLIAGLVFVFVRWRIGSIRRQSLLKQKIADTEMQALRAQMNPHFIFNSLNSIENFIMQNEKRLASDYLNKFARLIRMILDSSRQERIPVAKDMEALQLYIDLEQLRFNNKFVYKSDVDPVLLNGDYRVPTLLIQPFVENAIVHGLAHSERKDLYLSVKARLEKDCIRYVIEDNGVGRSQAAAYNQHNKPNHESVGVKITEERISLLNQQAGTSGFVVFTDLFDEQNQPAGTRVEITLKSS